MQVEKVLYQGRHVPVQGFRVFVYSYDNQSKLVNSWEQYQAEIASGLWFSSKENIPDRPTAEQKPIKKERNK